MTVNDYMGLTKCSQRSFKLVRTGVEYKNKFNLEIDPYFLGIWLGDGTVGNTAITSADEEIKESHLSVFRISWAYRYMSAKNGFYMF